MWIFFLDTEGCGSPKGENYDVKVFSLAVMISSFFIYNSFGVIDERSINKLSLITKLSENIQISEDNDE